MHIYVQSAGTKNDYHWLSELPGAGPLGWHSLLVEMDKAFAMVAGYSCGSWHIELRNLLLPGVTDEIASRQIVFSICFSGLVCEADVRALALAYLASELKLKKSRRPIGRYIPELAAAYRPTADGDFDFDTTVAQEWARQVIDGKDSGDSTPALGKILCTLNPDNPDEVERLRRQMECTALTAKEGLRLICSDMPVDTMLHADIILRYTNTAGTWKLVEFSKDTPRKQNDSPMPRDNGSSTFAQAGRQLCRGIAQSKLGSRLGPRFVSPEQIEELGTHIGSKIGSRVDSAVKIWKKTFGPLVRSATQPKFQQKQNCSREVSDIEQDYFRENIKKNHQ